MATTHVSVARVGALLHDDELRRVQDSPLKCTEPVNAFGDPCGDAVIDGTARCARHGGLDAWYRRHKGEPLVRIIPLSGA